MGKTCNNCRKFISDKNIIFNKYLNNYFCNNCNLEIEKNNSCYCNIPNYLKECKNCKILKCFKCVINKCNSDNCIYCKSCYDNLTDKICYDHVCKLCYKNTKNYENECYKCDLMICNHCKELSFYDIHGYDEQLTLFCLKCMYEHVEKNKQNLKIT